MYTEKKAQIGFDSFPGGGLRKFSTGERRPDFQLTTHLYGKIYIKLTHHYGKIRLKTDIFVVRRDFLHKIDRKPPFFFENRLIFPDFFQKQTHLYGNFAQNAPIVTELRLIKQAIWAAHPRIPTKSKSPPPGCQYI